MRKAHVPFALCSVETLERQNDALPRLEPLQNSAGQQLVGTFLDLAFRDPTGQQFSYPSACERSPPLLDHSVGEPCRLRRLRADDDQKAPGRVAQPMRGSQDAGPD